MVICVILFWGIPMALFGGEYTERTADMMIETVVPACILGGLIGIFVSEILEKKLPQETYIMLNWIVSAVMLLLVVLAAIAGIRWFGQSMGLL